ncbi:hypothetical protein A3B51_00475 [Candidatus Curtissbacteria bacterium RIFCSPLOWO2_01_FULL_41_18]|uniref:Uncharacterized protein n=2 Tax=Candidatus Curtissiibacteriota TaxID=1752717 RepID=A0A1F5G147_9BACT|nr:MAG: hypothetical protein A2696_03320 [Candidatus Curtissbacteria bacterium RIFCSPHIGHO2_01_FULL_41_13]OGE04667.1 MAG: hypothetical protein A3B51_00475 [Candidatus Curtissbacteria bacterium RIFCSPLOWO2_01_FULL_41_18]
MSTDRKTEWPNPTIDQAISAGMALATYYGRTFGKIDTGEQEEYQPITDQEAEQRLLNLADGIMNGEVTSHRDVARVIQSLGMLMGPMGSASTEIDLAAFRVSHAVLQKQTSFSDYTPA